MLSIRKVKTKSGSKAIQVVVYQGKRISLVKHIGSGKTEDEVKLLQKKAEEFISEYSGQLSLFPEVSHRILFVDRAVCLGVTHQFARDFLICCAKECGIAEIDNLLLDFAIMRLIFPASKLRTIKMLSQYFNIHYSERVYRKIPKLVEKKSIIQQKAYQLAKDRFNEQFYFILYDVTTLYFETFKSDELRIPGYSKDNKHQQPQIVVGLLVTPTGFPISYEVFPGNTFEGKTMLPMIEEFANRHVHTKLIVVADAAMLSEDRLAELKKKNISYIVGARIAGSKSEVIKKIHEELNKQEGAVIRLSTPNYGDLVCDFSAKRYAKQLNDFNKQIKKAKDCLAEKQSSKTVKFVKRVSEEKLELNDKLIEKHKLLLGIKGYYTDLAETDFSNQTIISSYHNLWRIEQSFRMSKTDLETRPIFHHKKDAICAHVLICFAALIMEKYLELTTGLSLQKVRDLIWDVTETRIQDTITNKIFTFLSPTDSITQSPLLELVIKWKLLPH